MKQLAIVLPLVLCLFACNSLTLGDKYQIVASQNGNVYRLEKTSGKVWLIKGNTMEEVSMQDFKLIVRQRYKGADGYSFVYLGKGRFAEIQGREPGTY